MNTLKVKTLVRTKSNQIDRKDFKKYDCGGVDRARKVESPSPWFLTTPFSDEKERNFR